MHRFSLSLLAFCTFFSHTSCFGATPENISTQVSQVLEGRHKPGSLRYQTMAKALKLMCERGAMTLVETGTARAGVRGFGGDGGSSVVFADWAKRHNAQFYSVDINHEAVLASRKELLPYQGFAEVIEKDSVEYLRNFAKPIDFLYLDSYDFENDNPGPSQEHHLKEIMAAYPKLTKKSIVLIDDCGLPHGGKGTLAIHFLLSKGWKVVKQGYQVLLVQKQ